MYRTKWSGQVLVHSYVYHSYGTPLEPWEKRKMIFLVFDNYRQTIEIDEIYYDLELADTAGQVDYEQVRLVSN